MNASKLVELMKSDSGNLKAFAEKIGVKYTTLYQATKSDDKLENMNLSIFLAICDGLGMRPEALIESVTYELIEFPEK